MIKKKSNEILKMSSSSFKGLVMRKKLVVFRAARLSDGMRFEVKKINGMLNMLLKCTGNSFTLRGKQLKIM